ncbi:MAG: hypothetical protein HRU33_12080 [Rhodobacteraceae bacterium]|nr:hypothetical protein [Paracoccaceae bacterium]
MKKIAFVEPMSIGIDIGKDRIIWSTLVHRDRVTAPKGQADGAELDF